MQNKRNGFPSRSYQTEVPSLTEEEIIAAKMYFFKKATLEVKRFLKPSKYKDVSQEIDDILTYTGLILPTDDESIVDRATQVMKDLTSTMFCVL